MRQQRRDWWSSYSCCTSANIDIHKIARNWKKWSYGTERLAFSSPYTTEIAKKTPKVGEKAGYTYLTAKSSAASGKKPCGRRRK